MLSYVTRDVTTDSFSVMKHDDTDGAGRDAGRDGAGLQPHLPGALGIPFSIVMAQVNCRQSLHRKAPFLTSKNRLASTWPPGSGNPVTMALIASSDGTAADMFDF